MNYSPDNEGGLLSLVEALRAGLDPAVGYQLMGGIETQQASQLAQRQDRLSGLADLLMGAAQGGSTYGGAEALMQAAPGPAGPAAQNILQSLYPGAAPVPGQEIPSFAPDFMAGGSEGDPSMQSPVFQQDPMAALQMAQGQQDLALGEQQLQLGAQELETAPDPSEEAWAAFGQSMINEAGNGTDSTAAYQTFIMTNPSAKPYLNAEPGRVHAIMQQVFHPEG
jgi:hypothetical protein